MNRIRKFFYEMDKETEKRDKITGTVNFDGNRVPWKDVITTIKASTSLDEKHVIDKVEITVGEMQQYLKLSKKDTRSVWYFFIGFAATIIVPAILLTSFAREAWLITAMLVMVCVIFAWFFIYQFKLEYAFCQVPIGKTEVFIRFDKEA